jgi:hypothetical protein
MKFLVAASFLVTSAVADIAQQHPAQALRKRTFYFQQGYGGTPGGYPGSYESNSRYYQQMYASYYNSYGSPYSNPYGSFPGGGYPGYPGYPC